MMIKRETMEREKVVPKEAERAEETDCDDLSVTFKPSLFLWFGVGWGVGWDVGWGVGLAVTVGGSE